MTIARLVSRALALCILAVACNDGGLPSDPEELIPPEPQGMAISNARSSSSVARGAAAQAGGVTYISASPGTLVDATSVRITNRSSAGSPVVAPVIDNGFDPVTVTAQSGDELGLEIMRAAGITETAIKVPPRRPPKVVRTNPSKGRTDVALNVQIEIIFSEPVDKGTITESSITLKLGNAAVPGRVEIADDGIHAAFIPDEPLLGLSSYTLTIHNIITDQDGDALEASEILIFGTTSAPPIPAAGRIAFVSTRDGDLEIYTSDPGGGNALRLTKSPGYDGEIAWSPDGARIAFVSAETNEASPTQSHNIFIMNADGSGRVQLTTSGFAAHPSWSPDGKQIVFSYRNGGWDNSTGDIAIIDVAAGEPSTHYLGLSSLGAGQPVWVPDGTRILFLARSGYYDHWHEVATVKPDGTGLETLVASDPNVFLSRAFSSPSFSPDGTRLVLNWCSGNDALVACTGGSGLMTMRYPSGELTYFQSKNPGDVWYSAWNASWSPDGTRLALSRRLCSGCQPLIGYATPDGLDLGTLPGNAWDPVWNPKQ